MTTRICGLPFLHPQNNVKRWLLILFLIVCFIAAAARLADS